VTNTVVETFIERDYRNRADAVENQLNGFPSNWTIFGNA
jgi:hypothetical protein